LGGAELREFRFHILLILLVALSACSSLPNGGPTSSAILENSYPKTTSSAAQTIPDYEIVKVTPAVLSVLAENEPRGFNGTFGQGWPVRGSTLGIGDTVGITIYEATTGGLFGTGDTQGAGTKNVTLPPQQIDSAGRISVPFAGNIKAAGRTPEQVQGAIVRALKGKAVDPQVIVTITQNGSRFVAVSGEVGQGGRFPLNASGDRVLDAIALAGGPKTAAYQIYVRLTRGSRSSVMKLDALVSRPSENVHLAPGDQVFLYRNPQSFTILGALARNANVEFDSEKISLAEALGKGSGLIDQRSDASGVFVFRFESSKPRFAKKTYYSSSGSYPVVYHINLRDARGIFLSQAFNIRNKDVVYVSTAPATDLQKFLQILGSGVGIAGATSQISVIAP
jgi:polysaccharide biosynthesis/export protein